VYSVHWCETETVGELSLVLLQRLLKLVKLLTAELIKFVFHLVITFQTVRNQTILTLRIVTCHMGSQCCLPHDTGEPAPP